MKKNAILGIFLSLFCFFALSSSFAQGLPFVLGAVLETGSGLLESNNYGSGIVRTTPFVGVWIDGIGFARVGISTGSREIDSTGFSEELKRLDFSAQVGFSAIGPQRPYIAGSYVRSKAYSPSSDIEWNELGLGIGHRFSLSPFAAIVVEAEHRWIMKHYDRIQRLNISGTRLQMNFGLMAHVL
ncbi:MAG: porin family protein [Fibromonadaceae bacterium]|jgi:hypothetical protein|nr:porin family protein [Fibromonadaceae bacterium]